MYIHIHIYIYIYIYISYTYTHLTEEASRAYNRNSYIMYMIDNAI